MGQATKLGDKPNPEDLIGLTKIVLDEQKKGNIDRVVLCSNKFVNTMTQQPTLQQLIPLSHGEKEESQTSSNGIIFMSQRQRFYWTIAYKIYRVTYFSSGVGKQCMRTSSKNDCNEKRDRKCGRLN